MDTKCSNTGREETVRPIVRRIDTTDGQKITLSRNIHVDVMQSHPVRLRVLSLNTLIDLSGPQVSPV